MPKHLITGIMSAALLAGGGYVAHAQNVSATQQAAICTGQVLSNTGEEVIGATIKVKGTDKATSTNIDGKFSLTGIKKGAVLEISCIGYNNVEVTWNGEPLNITMNESTNELDEVVVVGYGVQKKANVTGAVSTMSAKAIENRSVASISAAMAGEMPGVVVVQSSGAPGGQTGSITIRGNNTINSASPLVIVDGVPGSMNNIDPQDVESISVLKDAASAAIYGVQAANGVILITTKKGKLNAAPKISYSGMVSSTSPTTKLDPVNAYEYTFLMREALLNGNPNANVASYDAAIKKYESGELDKEGTNWWDETFKSHGTETSHTVQINGGSANTTYMASLGYLYQGGMLSQTDYNRYNVRSNLDSKIRPWLSAGLQIAFDRGISKDGNTGYASIVQHVNRLNATLPVYTEDGGFASPGSMQNPVAEAQKYATGISRRTTDNMNTNIYLNITPIEGLSIRPLFSWRYNSQDYFAFKKTLYYDNTWNAGDNSTRSGSHNYYNYNWMTYQAVASYMKTLAENHNINLMAGYEAQHYTYRYTISTREGGGDNALDQVLDALATSSMKNNDNGDELNRRSWFGRVQYDYATRYLFEANFRADASSRFPKDNRWGYFPAFSAGWRISQESFMEGTRDWLDQLKLRIGWGKTGNEELNEYYPAVATYAYFNSYIGHNQYASLYESRYVNPNLKWATVTNYEFGIEASMFNNRLSFEGSVYHRNTSDMLLNLPILTVLGVGAPAQNAGSVINNGVDITISHRNRINKDWSYSITVNAGYNHNKISNLRGTDGQVPNSAPLWYLQGEAIGSYYGYICDGIFKDEAEVEAGPLRTGTEKPGNLRFKDISGPDGVPDGKITEADRAVMGKINPSWMGGVNIGVNFRDFDLSMLWQGAFDYERYMTGEASQAFYNNGTMNKWQMRERWTPENPNGTYPRLYSNSSGSPDVIANSFWCEDASYVRLKNLTIGYTLPRALTEKAGIDLVRVFFNGENLLTFSKIYDKGIDPEAPAGRGAYYANVRKLSLGLKVSF